jgi:ABC-type transport system substrate-binding protein
MKTVEWGVFDPMGRGEQKGLVGTASMYRTAGRPEPSPRYQTTLTSTGVQHLLGDPQVCPAACQEMDKIYEAAVSERDDAKRALAMNKMTEIGANTWVVVPIIEGMGYWAVNPKRVGQFKPIPGRHEFGDVAERMPRPEQKPWN